MEVFTKVPTKEEYIEENIGSLLMSDRMMCYYHRDGINVREVAKEFAEEDWEDKWTPSGRHAKYYYDTVVISDGLFSLY